MSEVINWLTQGRGPESVIIYGDWYDYELSTSLYYGPTAKEDVKKSIHNIFAEVDTQFQDNIQMNVRTNKSNSGWIEYDYNAFIEKGASTIRNEIWNLWLESNWNKEWEFAGYITDNDGTWEFSFRRHNFV